MFQRLIRPGAARLVRVAAGALFAAGAAAYAAPDPAAPRTVSFEEAPPGALLVKTGTPGRHITLPRVASHIAADVSAGLVRTTVTQRFLNPTNAHLEATYVWPTPPGAAVDHLRLQIGDRFIEGEIQEKLEARRTYEAAKAQGRRAGLVERHRPNLFTTAVANIGPGESVIVQIAYQDWIAPQDGAYRLRIPTAVTPRYVSPTRDAPRLQRVAHRPNPTRAPPQPLFLDPAVTGGDMISPVSIEVTLNAGFTIGAVESSYHAVTMEGRGAERTVRTHGAVEADRDFELVWRAKGAAAVEPALFHEKAKGREHYLLTLHPGDLETAAQTSPRDLTLVLDVSGSMSGASIRQAKAALHEALDSLRPADRFAVVTFQSHVDRYALTLQDATPDAIRSAKAYVTAVETGGGTELSPALKAAFDYAAPHARGRVSQMLLITDAAVGGEAALLNQIAQKRGAARVFAVGIGSAANAHFIERAARLGGGTSVQIGDIGDVGARMSTLIHKLVTPVMTDLRIDGADGADIHPRTLPDLYAGEPLTLAVRADRPLAAPIVLSGLLNGRRVAHRLPPGDATKAPGAAKVWADRAIASLEEDVARGILEPTATDARILLTALDYGLVTRLTSLVAVEKDRISRSLDDPLLSRSAPNAAPAGWEFGGVDGPDVKTRETRARRAWRSAGAADRFKADAFSRPPGSSMAESRALRLPQTGLDVDGRTLLALLMAVAAIVLVRRRRPDRRTSSPIDGARWR